MEIWKSVKQNKYYEVSNLGNVRSLDRVTIWRGVPKMFKGKDLKLSSGVQGYISVNLYNNKVRKLTKVHRLVAEAFCSGDSTLDVDHINHNRSDNRAENLRFVTDSQNSRNRKTAKGYTKLSSKYVSRPYHAKTKLHGKQITIGYFATPYEATKAHSNFLLANYSIK
jgi:hypothetical protein